MKGYVVEIDPQIETALSSVMPGVSWKTWTPFYMEESDNLIDTWRGRVIKYLSDLPETEGRVSSQVLKKAVRAEKVSPTSWTKVLQKIALSPKKEIMGKGLCFPKDSWQLVGRSLVRISASQYGFDREEAV